LFGHMLNKYGGVLIVVFLLNTLLSLDIIICSCLSMFFWCLMSKGENLCIKAYLNLRGKLILMGDVLVWALPSVIFMFLAMLIIWTSVSALNLRGKLILMGDVLVWALPIVIFMFLAMLIIWTSVSAAMNYLASIV
jgi:hypothetical protein